ncbi:hypothetical protein L596_024626 [Steinernema carpocapsae]|uniref:J domain-containing protein n=1 Tax=Steinernema carpocapsae TaxID=34508 RepID=A0A4U5M598_STECR|nr:hypothetical protein L596_024626 [Steinernema carpocapsae]
MRSTAGILVFVLVLASTTLPTYGFSMDDLALYDLVEDVNENFYKFFGIEQTATLGEIKKAYRRLSLEWHPDRNDAPEANDQFRKIAGIYDILKNKDSRQKYDDVLEFGLPDWRQPIYYFRRVRKLHWWETVLVVFVVCSVGHYLMMWGSYYEKTLETRSNKKKRKDKKKGNVADTEEDTTLDQFKPKFFDLLPFTMVRGCVILAEDLKFHLVEYLERSKEAEEPLSEPEEYVRPKRPTAEPVVYEMAIGVKAVTTNDAKMAEKYLVEQIQNSVEKDVSTKGQKWSKEEISKLIKLSTTKFPVGSSNRWQNLARELNRSVDDITSTIEKLRKKGCTRQPSK